LPIQGQNFLSSVGVDIDLTFPMIAGGLMMTRFLVALNLTPYLGVKPVPGNIRTSTAMALTFFSYPLVVPGLDRSQLPHDVLILMALFFKEAMFGMLMGLVNSMVFFGIQSAGSMVDNQRYVANARIFNPALGAQTSIFGIFYYQLTMAIFISLGGHRYFISALIESFQKVPLLTLPVMGPGITPVMDLAMRLASDTLIICLQLSAPVLIAIFVADLVLGLTNRIAPMINVFEMGFNIKGFVGVLLVYMALPVTLFQAKHWFHVMIDDFYKITQFFR
jgi:type III secretory pathway component EscT